MRVPARLVRIRQETPTVKSFLFDLGDAPFSFLPGQWVDLYIDIGASLIVGGFSIVSSPLQRGTIRLAIKKLPWGEASVYLHDHAKVGDSFLLEGGSGDFYYQKSMADTLILIAGGIGITPIMSIIRYVDEACPEVEATLIYSATAPSETVFLSALSEISARNPKVKCVFTMTGPGAEFWNGRVGRIDLPMLREHLPAKPALWYVCGPSGMIKDVEEMLGRVGVDPSRVKAERWW